MLKKALEVYDTMSIKEVLLSCDKENPASAGVIINCGGELIEECYSETFQSEIQRYVIKR